MTSVQTVRVAVHALLRHKMRSFLTALGVIIGVAAVIAMVSVGEGAKKQVQEAFASMGADLLVVLPGTTTRGGAFGGFGSLPTLTWDDLKAIREEVPDVRAATAVLRSPVQVLSEDQNWTTTAYGTAPEYFGIRSWQIAQGEFFTTSDVEGGNKVAVLGDTVNEKLFGAHANPVGQSIRVNNIPFLVVGLLAEKGQSPTGQDYDDTMYVPQSTYLAKIQGGLKKFISGVIYVGAKPGKAARAQRLITDLLRDRHHIQTEKEDDFSIRNLAEMAAAQEEGTRTLTTLLASIAAVSLLVGGIGIMNIMLVSVTERTREIGIRMAVGARPRDILAQFLAEALTLSLAGGLIGIGVGIFVAKKLAARFSWTILIKPTIVLISVGFSMLVGVVFGLYPARKASQLDPIDALRFE